MTNTPQADTRSGKSWKQELMTYMRTQGQYAARGRAKIVSNRTMEAREQGLFLCFNDLTALGYAIRTVHNLRQKHVKALVAHWVAKDLSASSIQNRLSLLRELARYLNRADVVGPTEMYVTDPRLAQRRTVAEEDQSWSAQGVDAQVLIDEVSAYDVVTGMQLRLMHAFFLRREEAVMFRPHKADNVTYIAVVDGTKGGRLRNVDIDTDYQRDVLDRAKAMVHVKSGYLGGGSGRDLKQALRHFDYVCGKFGICKSGLGISSHGLRHQGLNDYFERLAGRPSPVRGGGSLTVSDFDEQQRIDFARRKVTEAAGHARLSITGAYLGGQIAARKSAGLVPKGGSTGDAVLDTQLARMERWLEIRRLSGSRDLTTDEQEELAVLDRLLGNYASASLRKAAWDKQSVPASDTDALTSA